MKRFALCQVNNILLILFVFLFVSVAPVTAQSRETLPGPVQGDVLAVLDGDTVSVRLHVWIGQEIITHVRIAGIDAPEIHAKCDSERKRAFAAKDALSKLLTDKKIRLYNVRLAKYAGRVLAEARNTKGVQVADYMLDNGLARPYHGEKRSGWCK